MLLANQSKAETAINLMPVESIVMRALPWNRGEVRACFGYNDIPTSLVCFRGVKSLSKVDNRVARKAKMQLTPKAWNSLHTSGKNATFSCIKTGDDYYVCSDFFDEGPPKAPE